MRSSTCAVLVALLAGSTGCNDPAPDAKAAGAGGWHPGAVLASEHQGVRGMLDLRGLVHAHSVYSHDACDGEPREGETGPIDEVCFEDFRRGLCQVQHDFVMLTDHSASFRYTEFPEALLYRPERGDELVERGGLQVASRATCPDSDHRTLLTAGTETDTMPVGLDEHVAPDPEGRQAVYGATTPEAVQVLKDHGAVVLLQHTEDWSVDQIVDLGVDGFEMYNLHANTILGAGGVFALLADAASPEELPYSDLVLLPIVNEDERYLSRWGGALHRGARTVTTMGTDCHRNTFQQLLPDGERIDSYRRMMGWFSNHLLVKAPDGQWDDADLEDALRAARLYGVFELIGYPEGFDYHAEHGADLYEMGAEAPAGSELRAVRPRVRELDAAAPQPEIALRLLRAREDGWDVVEETAEGELRVAPKEPGAYRVEVRMRPKHLAPHLSSYADLADKSFVWIYSNAIHLAP